MYELFMWVWRQDGYGPIFCDTEAEALETKRIWGGEVFPVYRKTEDAKTKK